VLTKSSLICELSALRGRVGERAGHFLLNALHSAGADADLARRGVDAYAGLQQLTDAIFDRGAYLGATPPRSRVARLYHLGCGALLHHGAAGLFGK
jgi:hypothetical protein